MSEFSLEEAKRALAAVENEIALRKRVYPRWVAEKRKGYSQFNADRRIADMDLARLILEAKVQELDNQQELF